MNACEIFHALHCGAEPMILPNAWDALSARVLAHSGFEAIATTSWGMSNALGRADGGQLSFSELKTAVEHMLACIDRPLSVDIEAGHAAANARVADHVECLADLGVVGINIEDARTGFGEGQFSAQAQADRLACIRQRLDDRGHGRVFINARIDSYFQSNEPLADALHRADVYQRSGADGVFVPGMTRAQDIDALVAGLTVPLNLMCLPGLPSLQDLAALGVRRLSLGMALSQAVIAHLESLARQVRAGEFSALLNHAPPQTQFQAAQGL